MTRDFAVLFIILLTSSLVGCGKRNNTFLAAGQSNMSLSAPGASLPYLPQYFSDSMRVFDHPVTVTPAAVSGSPLSCWSVGGQCFKSLAPLKSVHFQGVIWWQGETDAITCKSDLSSTYAVRFTQMIADWRVFFGNPNLPFYIVQLGHPIASFNCNGVPTKWEEVKAAQALVASTVPHVYAVKTDDITFGNDIHPNYAYQEIGRRLAILASKNFK